MALSSMAKSFQSFEDILFAENVDKRNALTEVIMSLIRNRSIGFQPKTRINTTQIMDAINELSLDFEKRKRKKGKRRERL